MQSSAVVEGANDITLQPFILALPLTALNDALRAIMNEARPLSDIALELAILAAWTIVSFFVALKIFRWR